MPQIIRNITKLVASVPLIAAAISSASADVPLDVSREKVVPIDFVVVELKTPYSSKPYAPGSTGTVWSRKIGHEMEVAEVRLHVKVSEAASLPFEIRVSDMNGQEIERIDSDSPLIRDGEFWTSLVPGRKAKLELVTTSDPTPIEILVDRYAYSITSAKPQATVGADDKIEIKDAPSEIFRLSPPIARLVIMMQRGGAYCTGFLLTKNLLLTNQHCIQNDDEARSTVAEFKYENPNPKPSQYHVLKLEAVDKSLDYALVRVDRNPGEQFKPVDIGLEATGIAEKMNLAVIQHPAGRPKMAAIKDCKIDGLNRMGVEQTGTDFGHSCDTLGGSSGSPVFALSGLRVVGLHHLGFREGIDLPVNQAVYLSKVLADVKDRNPVVYAEIIAAHQ
jgi:V8-like Glu-specific endopeptidase